MKKRKLVKQALNKPNLFAPAELSYFQLWLRQRKAKKEAKKQRARLMLERAYLL
jgi:hypothetical protein